MGTWKVAGITAVWSLALAGMFGRPDPALGTPVDLTLTTPPGIHAGTQTGSIIAAPLSAVLDDFNRPDGPIGPNWNIHSGYFNVVSNAAQGGNLAVATFIPYTGAGNEAQADVSTNGTSLQYTGLVLSYGGGVTNVFTKVQDQTGDGLFETAACYLGNNASGGSFGLGFFSLSSPFATAHMRVTQAAGTVTIELTNIDGGSQAPQTYVCNGAPPPEGTGIGIDGYDGTARIDNFAAASKLATAPVLSAAGLVLAAAVLLLVGGRRIVGASAQRS